MSVNITIGQSGGITHAIKAEVESRGGSIRNDINASIWGQVMSEVKTANGAQAEGQKFYTGGEDTEKLNNRANWKTDFQVAKGQVITLAQNVWNKIVALLTGESSKPKESTTQSAIEKTSQKTSQKTDGTTTPDPKTPVTKTPEQSSTPEPPVVKTPVQSSTPEPPVIKTPVQSSTPEPPVVKTPVQNSPVTHNTIKGSPVADQTSPQNSPLTPLSDKKPSTSSISEVITSVKNLKSGETYTFQKRYNSYVSVGGDVQLVNTTDNYSITKGDDGNFKVQYPSNTISTYDSDGNIMTSEYDDVIHFSSAKNRPRVSDDYNKDTKTIDLSNVKYNYLFKENPIIDDIAVFDNAEVYDKNNNLLFTSLRATYEYGPESGDSVKRYHFKSSDGKDLSKDEVMNLIKNNKLSKLVEHSAFDLDHVREYHTLEQDLDSQYN